MMAYLSMLTAREVFEEVYLGFMVVGHTHEDVDGMFGHFSESMMHNPTYSLPDLMSLLMRARTPNAIPHFLQEVPDFKSYLAPFMLKGPDALVGHLKPRLYRFYVRHDSMPCFQYKMKSTDEGWLPKEGIEIWSWKDDRSPHIPNGVPQRLPMMEMKMLNEVQGGLKKHVSFFEFILKRTIEEEPKQRWTTLINYWNDIIHTLEGEQVEYQPNVTELEHGFWPLSIWRDHVPLDYRNVACELEAVADYVGPQKDRPRESFNPRVDVVKDSYVLVRPDDLDLDTYPVHMGLVVTNVVEGPLNEQNLVTHVCDVEWFRPVMTKKRGQSDWQPQERWINAWDKKWERDPSPTYKEPATIEVSSALWCFNARKGPATGYIAIPKTIATKAIGYLKSCIEASL